MSLRSPRSHSLLRRVAARGVDGVLLLAAAWLLLGPRGPLRAELRSWLDERRRVRLVAQRWTTVVGTGAALLGDAPRAGDASGRRGVARDRRAPDGASTGGIAPPGAAGPGPVLAVFTDYRCPFCRLAEDELAAALAARPGARVVVRHLPIAALHSDAPLLARVSVCAEADAAWPAVHRALYQAPSGASHPGASSPVRAALMAVLARAGAADPEGVLRCADGPAARRRVAGDVALARELGLTGTPAFVAPGRVEIGALSRQRLLEMLGPS